MKISSVTSAPHGGGPKTTLEPQLHGVSLFLTTRESPGELALAGLLGEALFGVAPTASSPFNVEPGTSFDFTGEIHVDGAEGKYRIRRHQQSGGPRLTIVAEDGRAADANTLQRMTHGLTPALMGRVFFWRRDERGLLSGLLSDQIASEYLRAIGWQAEPSEPTLWASTERYERRDAIAAQIELLLAERRRTGHQLEQTTSGIETRIAELAGKRTEIVNRLHNMQAKFEEIETSLRYQAIAETAEREIGSQPPIDWAPRLDDIEQEITRWRTTLADLEQRESELRSELAKVHPDEGSPILPLADQRAAIAVAVRLTRDIESEVARLARAADSNACVCNDAHPRLNPLVDTLGGQLRRLEELTGQQQQAVQVQELYAEAEHVSRSQRNLRQQLDHLLKRRQELWRTGRPRQDRVKASSADGVDTAALAEHRGSLQQQVMSLRKELESLDGELADLRCQHEAITERRNSLLSDERLTALQQQLEIAQQELEQPAYRSHSSEDILIAGQGRWRASELFAKLTDGRYRSLRLVSGGRDLVAVDTYGSEHFSANLSDQDADLAAISLMIAMAAGLAQHQVVLPMVFDDPFAILDARHAAILVNVLDDFARSGRQIFVLTQRREAIDRFAALGITPLSEPAPAPVEPPAVIQWRPPTPAASQVVTPATIATSPSEQVVTKTYRTTSREYLLDHDDPIERFPAVMANRTNVFARGRVRTVSDLLSADPSALAEELDRDDVTAELVALWQTHLSLVCFVPGVSFDDAIALAGAGIYSPEDLAAADAEQLNVQLESYLASDSGARLRTKGYSFDRFRAADLISRGDRGVRHWRSSSHWDRWSRHRGERRQRVSSNASRRSSRSHSTTNSGRSTRITRTTSTSSNGETSSLRVRKEKSPRSHEPKQKEKPKRRFYLETSSPIVDAPSIGPKTAIKLERAGLQTVDDLIEADAPAIAAQIDARGIDAEKIVAWQHQAQLVCRIPQLRGHDAQIMVASGFTAPEEIASMKPSELLEFVEPFCSSSEGLRVLRNAAPPDLEEVTNWISWARESRTLGVA